MYAITSTPSVSDPSTLNPSAAADARLRRNLSAVYARDASALRELARRRVRTSTNAWDAVQDAFLFVLEHPPKDTSERTLAGALESAVRTACGRQARQRADDVTLEIALRKRFPV
jgi:DNA-directed RNA polymerase specialized sigma24 family protein